MSPAAMQATRFSRVPDMLWRLGANVLGGSASARRLSILIFHRVVAEPDPLFPGEMHARRFDVLCAWLKACFNVLPLHEAVHGLRSRTLPPRALAITFDDGYADNHEQALPILLRHRLPASFFVASGFLDGGRMFNDTVVESVRRAPGNALPLGMVAGQPLGTLPMGDDEQRAACIGVVLKAVKHLPMAERDAAVEAVWHACGKPELPEALMMRSEQVRQLHRQGMMIGAHTRNHPILARLSRQAMHEEISRGRDDLQAITGAPVSLFAYPNGRPHDDYNAHSVEVVRELGFEAAVSTAWGSAHAGSDTLQLPRFSPWDRDPTRYGLRLLGNLRREQAELA